MTWKTLLSVTKAAVAIIAEATKHLGSLIDAWNNAPPEAAAQRKEALETIGRLQNSIHGELDRADIKDLEAE